MASNGMKLAIVPKHTIKYIREFCREMQDVIEEYEESYQDGDDNEKVIAKVLEGSDIYNHLRHLVLAYETIFSNACDPTISHINFHPGFEFNHVAPEQ